MRKEITGDDSVKDATAVVTQAAQDKSFFDQMQVGGILAAALGFTPATDVVLKIVGEEICLFLGGTPSQCTPKQW